MEKFCEECGCKIYAESDIGAIRIETETVPKRTTKEYVICWSCFEEQKAALGEDYKIERDFAKWVNDINEKERK